MATATTTRTRKAAPATRPATRRTTTTRTRKAAPATRPATRRTTTTPAAKPATRRTPRRSGPFEMHTGTEDAGISRKGTYAIVACDGAGVLLGKIYIPIDVAEQHPGDPELILRWA